MLCIGHRGAMGHEPENTLRSVRRAIDLGASWIEIDVYAVDGELVVFHDDRLERTTNGRGYLVEQSFAALRALDAGQGEQIPTLDEVLQLARGKLGVNVELKGPGTADPVVRCLTRHLAGGWSYDQFLVSSFNHHELMRVTALDRRLRLGVLLYGIPVDYAACAEKLGAYSVNPSIDFIDQQFVDDAHARKLNVWVHTVNYPEDIARMRALGVDAVFTNYPERVLRGSA